MLPEKSKTDAEIFYNNVEYTRVLVFSVMAIGVLLLLIVFRSIIRNTYVGRKTRNTADILTAIALLYLSMIMCLRDT